MQNAIITGVSSFLPDYVLGNDEIAQMVDTTNEWIMTRVGIRERRILKGEGLGSSYMGARAVESLLTKTQTAPEDVELVICATSTSDYKFPSTASIIAEQVGIKKAFGYDIQAACSGFLVALQDGVSYVKSGMYKKVVVVASEKMSSMTNYKDRTTCPLFGDGAAAVMLEPSTEDLGFVDAILRTDGIGLPHLILKAGGSVYPVTHEAIDADMHFLYQEGKVVFKHAVSHMADVTETIMSRNGLTMDSIDWFVPHQANNRIIEAVANRIGIDREKVMVNIERCGNTSAASIPICLAEWEGQMKKGAHVIMSAFGAGFTWGSVYLKWAYDPK